MRPLVRAMLEMVLSRHPTPVTIAEAASATGYSLSSIRQAASPCRHRGWLGPGPELVLTAAGVDAIRQVLEPGQPHQETS